MVHALRFDLTFLIVIFALTACSNTGQSEATPLPSATPFPTFQFVAPTNPPVFNATTSAENVDTPDTEVIETGRRRYETLECATCHGENGEGTAKASSLLEIALSQADFISLMRSGGDIGSSHQYSTNRLSERGAQAIYLYLKSLAGTEN